MSNIHIALASRIDFSEIEWGHSPISLYSSIDVEGSRLEALAAAMPVTDFQEFMDRVVLPYGAKIDLYLQQERRTTLQPMAEELGKLAFAFCPAAHAAILQYTGYDAPRHHVATEGGKLTLLAPDRSVLGMIYGTDSAARELANKICTFLDTQP